MLYGSQIFFHLVDHAPGGVVALLGLVHRTLHLILVRIHADELFIAGVCGLQYRANFLFVMGQFRGRSANPAIALLNGLLLKANFLFEALYPVSLLVIEDVLLVQRIRLLTQQFILRVEFSSLTRQALVKFL